MGSRSHPVWVDCVLSIVGQALFANRAVTGLSFVCGDERKVHES